LLLAAVCCGFHEFRRILAPLWLLERKINSFFLSINYLFERRAQLSVCNLFGKCVLMQFCARFLGQKIAGREIIPPLPTNKQMSPVFCCCCCCLICC
jgi:hypothetical protein